MNRSFWKGSWLLVWFIGLASQLQAQDSLPEFLPPLRIPMALSGNFAELRRNHFHTGIDIKTSGVSGQEVQAIASGVVSRISNGPYGYGLALYIDHPGGYTSVYGHLDRLSSRLQPVLREAQYAKQNFDVDFSPEEAIPVAAGELVAYSGNSGSSAGPHLHFEIRETASEHPLNPLLFGFDIQDNIAPHLRGLRFHPLSDSSVVDQNTDPTSYVLSGQGGHYTLKNPKAIPVYGAFGTSIHAIDFLNAAPNRCGVYRIALYIDGELRCRQQFNELSFATVRHINAYTDYAAYKNRGWHYHKSFVEEGNELQVYSPLPADSGRISDLAPGTHSGRYEVRDAYGNTAILDFELEVLSKNPMPGRALPTFDAWFNAAEANSYAYPGELLVQLPKGSLFSDLRFETSVQQKPPGALSRQFFIHNENTPLKGKLQLRFSAPKVPAAMQRYVYVERSNLAGGTDAIQGEWQGSDFTATSSYFGAFTLRYDSLPPQVSAYSSNANKSKGQQLRFSVSDATTGIAAYRAEVNGQWVLLGYEPRGNYLYVDTDEPGFVRGSNTLVIRVRDGQGNETTEKFAYGL